MILTAEEIRDLAEYAGIATSIDFLDEGWQEEEFSIDPCPESGVMDDNSTVIFSRHVVTCDGCDGNECTPLGSVWRKKGLTQREGEIQSEQLRM